MSKSNHVHMPQANELSNETKASMRTRIISAIVCVAIILPLLFLGDISFLVLMVFLLAAAVFEIIHCAKTKYSIWLYIVSFIFAFVIAFWPIFYNLFLTGTGKMFFNGVQIKLPDWHLFTGFNGLGVPITALILGATVLFFMVVADANFEVRDACFIFTMILIISLGIQSITFIRFIPLYERFYIQGTSFKYFSSFNIFQSTLLVIYVCIATFLTDIGAYFVGVFFGKNKMNPRISPKKTWEGFFGGLIISTGLSFLFAFILALNKCPILSFLDMEHWYIILALSIIIPPISVLGDFVFSSIKRYYGIKDFSRLIPGHGGILDRLDSIIFSFLFAALLVSLVIYWEALVA
ncbi:MAG: phosphatidate cytidylyltransferase [Bacilli bacterium]|nr:phosphatidate cytidylyltransferase [Bacilli bacterium]